MVEDIPPDVKNAINVLKKVEEYEFGHEFKRFLFIMAIVGLIALIEGYISYLINLYVELDITQVMIFNFNDDLFLSVSTWLIHLSILFTLVVYTKSSKGLLDTWTPLLRQLGIIWGIVYVGSFLVNVLLISIQFEDYGPSIWAISIGIALIISIKILNPIKDINIIQIGFIFISLVLFGLSLVLPFLENSLRMFLLGSIVGLGLLILASILYLRI